MEPHVLEGGSTCRPACPLVPPGDFLHGAKTSRQSGPVMAVRQRGESFYSEQ